MADDRNPLPESLARTAKLVVAFSGLALVITVPVAMVPALPELARQFGGSGDGIFLAQTISTLPTLMMLVGAPLGGWVAELVGVRRCLLVSLAIYVITGTLSLAAPNLPILLAIRLLLGLSAGAASTLCTALTAEWYDGSRRNQILGYAHGVSTVYNILILLTGGWLVDVVGWRGTSIFYILGLLVFFSAWLVVKSYSHSGSREGDLPSIGILWRLSPFFVLTFIFASGTCMPIMQGPFLLRSIGMESAFNRGMATGLVLLVASVSSVSYGYLRRRFGNVGVLLITALSMGLGISLAGTFPDVRWIVFSYLVIGVGFGLYLPVVAAAILERSPPTVRARAIGLMTSSVLISNFTNPLIIAIFRKAFNLGFTFVLVGGVICLAGLLFIPFLLMTRRRSTLGPVPQP